MLTMCIVICPCLGSWVMRSFQKLDNTEKKIRDERKGLQERVTQRAGRNTKGKCHGYFNGISKPAIRFT